MVLIPVLEGIGGKGHGKVGIEILAENEEYVLLLFFFEANIAYADDVGATYAETG